MEETKHSHSKGPPKSKIHCVPDHGQFWIYLFVARTFAEVNTVVVVDVIMPVNTLEIV